MYLFPSLNDLLMPIELKLCICELIRNIYKIYVINNKRIYLLYVTRCLFYRNNELIYPFRAIYIIKNYVKYKAINSITNNKAIKNHPQALPVSDR